MGRVMRNEEYRAVMNQYSYPHWDGLESRFLLRLPDDLKDDIEEAANEDGIAQAEWIRRALNHAINLRHAIRDHGQPGR